MYSTRMWCIEKKSGLINIRALFLLHFFSFEFSLYLHLNMEFPQRPAAQVN